jgi:Uma2 family endonuclease
MTLAPPYPLADRVTGRVLMRNISWDTYSSLLEDSADGANRFTYDHGLLEIEMPSRHHEIIKRLVGEIVELCLRRSGVDYEPSGSATWRDQARLQGIGADECYHIQHAAEVRGKTELDLSVDPPPDLAIEVDLTSSAINKLQIYASLGVPEIWRVRADGACQMLLRADDGTYRAIDASVCIPVLTPAILARFVLLREQVGHSEALRRFEAEAPDIG